jgi:four helix bundle protein
MQPARTFEDLIVWQKAHQFVLEVYQITGNFSKSEIYGLASQFRRASISIPANIAEGFKKKGKADKLRFFNIAQGSLSETEYYLILANDLEYFNTDLLIEDVIEVGRLLESYMSAFEN